MPSPTPTLSASPPSSPEEAYAVYEDRVKNDVYATLAEQIAAMGPEALAHADYKVDFMQRVEENTGHYSYVDSRSGLEFTAIIFGEVMPTSAGTVVSAKGNYFPGKRGDPFVPIGDGAKCKDVLVLGTPTLATPELEGWYRDQLGALNAVRESDEKAEREKDWPGKVREWLRNPEGDNETVKELISITCGLKYGRPVDVKGQAPARVKRRAAGDAVAKDASASEASEDQTSEIKAGATYDPHRLPDYGGDYFNHVRDRLLQKDVRDPDNQLIPPWDAYYALRPGTLVVAVCTLHSFLMGKGTISERRYYQLNAHSIRVVDYSKERVVIPAMPTVPGGSRPAPGSFSTDHSNAGEALLQFSMPKRARLGAAEPSTSAAAVTASKGKSKAPTKSKKGGDEGAAVNKGKKKDDDMVIA
ncbi:hypothetical protein FPV67DRAFT_1674194 [Lyophyllum atratum]|nr:hypothetical protein FPV67DRAFT_1674194 [Lyophyllum atratum]